MPLAKISRYFWQQGFTVKKALRIVRAIDIGDVADTAQMVKLVDTPASGAGDRKVVEVRVFFWAPIQTSEHCFEASQKPAKAGFCVSGLQQSARRT
jgi:hypothetical protein